MALSIYMRVKNRQGKWRYSRIQTGKGHRIGQLQPPFFVRPFRNGKQVWHTLGAQNFKEADDEAEQLAAALDAQAKGLTVAGAEAIRNANRISIKSAVDTYLERKSGKAKRTIAQYRLALHEFIEAVGDHVRFLDEITESVLRSYKKFMADQGYAAKTIDTRMNIVFFLLKKNGITARIPRDEMPVVEEEAAVPYTAEELEKLFAAMNEEETVRYKFFLGTGCRDKEVTFASWNDIDWSKGEYHIRKKKDVGFFPKNHESRTIPLPKGLLESLRAWRTRAEHERWIFVNERGRPDNHFLRKLKRIAKRAGLNCGHCKTTITEGKYDKKKQIEVSCKSRPICEHFYLHRFRKTCATRWAEHAVPVRTIQAWLGHKNLETTMLYLGVTSTEKLRTNIDAAFSEQPF
jgi:integrase/recombinase XerD